MVYLDNAANKFLNTAAISAMTHVMTETFGNPSSLHAYGRRRFKELQKPVKKCTNTWSPCCAYFHLWDWRKHSYCYALAQSFSKVSTWLQLLLNTTLSFTPCLLGRAFGFSNLYSTRKPSHYYPTNRWCLTWRPFCSYVCHVTTTIY